MRVTLTAKQTKVVGAIATGSASNQEIAEAVGVKEPNGALLTRKMSEMGLVKGERNTENKLVWKVTDLGIVATRCYCAIAELMGGEPRITLTDKHILIMDAISNGYLTNREIADKIEVPESNTILLLKKMNDMGLITSELVVHNTEGSDSYQRGRKNRRLWAVTQLGMDVWGVVYRANENMTGEGFRQQAG